MRSHLHGRSGCLADLSGRRRRPPKSAAAPFQKSAFSISPPVYGRGDRPRLGSPFRLSNARGRVAGCRNGLLRCIPHPENWTPRIDRLGRCAPHLASVAVAGADIKRDRRARVRRDARRPRCRPQAQTWGMPSMMCRDLGKSRQSRCRLLARNRRSTTSAICPLSGEERTWCRRRRMSVFDPSRQARSRICRGATWPPKPIPAAAIYCFDG
jgi:hypothetical protein